MIVKVIIPVFNEAANIGEIVRALKARGLDVIVVDDASTDSSGEIARRQGARVLTQPQRSGKGASLLRGFAEIKESECDGVITMDGDAQHAVSDLDQFLAMAAEDPQSMIIGNRMKDVSRMPLIRRWTNQLMSLLISWLCGQRIDDSQCGYRYIGCDVSKA